MATAGQNGTTVLEFTDNIDITGATIGAPIMLARNNSFGRIVYTDVNQTIDNTIPFDTAINVTENLISVG